MKVGAAYVDCSSSPPSVSSPPPPRACATPLLRISPPTTTVPSDAELADIHADVAAGADIVKIAAMVQDITHVARLEKLWRTPPTLLPTPLSPSAWAAGQVSRFLAAKFGSFLAFGALRSGAESPSASPRSRSSAICTACPPSPRQPK